jgi:MoaA/NifB/PqqE/SkfB family radical SAM enzyme
MTPSLLDDPTRREDLRPPGKISFALDTLRLVFQEGGPGFVQFALNNACNANCGFCGFALDKLPKSTWHFVSREDGLNSIDILYRTGMRFLVFSGGEPTLNRNLVDFVRHANNLGMKVMTVTNGGLLKAEMVDELVAAWTRPRRSP